MDRRTALIWSLLAPEGTKRPGHSFTFEMCASDLGPVGLARIFHLYTCPSRFSASAILTKTHFNKTFGHKASPSWGCVVRRYNKC